MGEYIIHEKKGIAVSANGKIINKLPLDAAPIITEQNALAQALSYLNADEYYWQNKQHEQFLKAETKDSKATYYPKGELVFAYIELDGKEKSKNVLAYKFTIRTSKPKDENRLIYVDAKNKTVIKNVDLDPNCSGTNIQTNFNGTQQISTYTNSFMSGWDMEDDYNH